MSGWNTIQYSCFAHERIALQQDLLARVTLSAVDLIFANASL